MSIQYSCVCLSFRAINLIGTSCVDRIHSTRGARSSTYMNVLGTIASFYVVNAVLCQFRNNFSVIVLIDFVLSQALLNFIEKIAVFMTLN
jgi:ADP-glucose pyrophosphorylase